MHIPVLKNEVIQYLDPKANENFIDCTIGQGGHTMAILDKNQPKGKVLGIDLDRKQIENCQALKDKFAERLILVNDSYANLERIVKENNFENINGILLDVGFSSFQTDESKKGFSFQRNEDLIMQYQENSDNLTAKDIVNKWTKEQIENILTEYSDEKFAKQIAKKIVEQREQKEINTTFDLVEIIKSAVPARFHFSGIHCATRTFQALRIVVNKELDNLEKVLPQALSVLNNNGKLIVISFHSLEDKIVKNFLKNEEKQGHVNIITKKPIVPADSEVFSNPRARSAKLRVAIKI